MLCRKPQRPMAVRFCKCFRSINPSSRGPAKVAPVFSGIGGIPGDFGITSFDHDDASSGDEVSVCESRNSVLRARQQTEGTRLGPISDAAPNFSSEDSGLTNLSKQARLGGTPRGGQPSTTDEDAWGVGSSQELFEPTAQEKTLGMDPVATEAVVNGVDPGNTGMDLRRASPSQHWGFVWHAQTMERCSQRVLEKVLPGSPADLWNKSHPGHELQLGDILVKVNGMGGRLEFMTRELGKTHVFCEFKPGEARRFWSSASSTTCASGSSQPPADACTQSLGTNLFRCDGPYPKIKPPIAPSLESLVSHNFTCAGGEVASSAGPRGMYRVELHRESVAQRWGFIWDDTVLERNEFRIVRRVAPGSLVSEWNATHPGQDVRAGDMLVNVNGTGKIGGVEAFSLELRKNDIVCDFRPRDMQLGKGEDNSMANWTSASCSVPQAPSAAPWAAMSTSPEAQCAHGAGAPQSGSCRSPAVENTAADTLPRRTGATPLGMLQAPQPSVESRKGSLHAHHMPPKAGHYHVELRRSSTSTRWGFVWEVEAMDRSYVRILSKVRPGTLADEWNIANPGREMQPGDTLVGVNGQTGRLELLTIELTKEHIVCEFKSVMAVPPETVSLSFSDSERSGEALGKHRPIAQGREPPEPPATHCEVAAATGRIGPAPLALSTRGTTAAPLRLPVETRLTSEMSDWQESCRRSQPPPAPSREPAAVAASAAAAAASAAAVAASAAAAAAVAAAALPGGGIISGCDEAAEDTDTDTTPQKPGSSYVVELRRSSPSERWGFEWEPTDMHQRKQLTLSKIFPGTPAASWNAANPCSRIQPGDVLTKVNGRAGAFTVRSEVGRMEMHTLELKSSRTTVVCEFRAAPGRPSVTCASSSEVVLPEGQGLPTSPHTAPLDVLKPPWWDRWPKGSGQETTAVSAAVRAAVQHIMDMGQDGASCAPRPAGRRFEVMTVLHNANAELWQVYCAARSRLKHTIVPSPGVSPPLGAPVLECMGTLDPEVGESLLLHGMKPNSVEMVCQGWFGDSLSAIADGLPDSVHLHETSRSADLCAQDMLEGSEAGLCALVLCRAVCGASLVMDTAGPKDMVNSLLDDALSASFDSAVCGDPESRSREVLVRDGSLVYPEYVVFYRRALVVEVGAV